MSTPHTYIVVYLCVFFLFKNHADVCCEIRLIILKIVRQHTLCIWALENVLRFTVRSTHLLKKKEEELFSTKLRTISALPSEDAKHTHTPKWWWIYACFSKRGMIPSGTEKNKTYILYIYIRSSCGCHKINVVCMKLRLRVWGCEWKWSMRFGTSWVVENMDV